MIEGENGRNLKHKSHINFTIIYLPSPTKDKNVHFSSFDNIYYHIWIKNTSIEIDQITKGLLPPKNYY